MDKKVFRNRVICIGGGMYLKNSPDREVELTGDILEACFFYEKSYCEKVAKSLTDRFSDTAIEMHKLFMTIEVQDKEQISSKY
jgi:hypothetical protein